MYYYYVNSSYLVIEKARKSLSFCDWDIHYILRCPKHKNVAVLSIKKDNRMRVVLFAFAY